MRRGRPSKSGDLRAPKPSPSPLRGSVNDPWAALDTGSVNAPETEPSDDASVRFPALDEFSLLHDSQSKFAFDVNQNTKRHSSRDISQLVTDALADDAFVQPKAPSTATQPQPPPKPQQAESGSKSNTVYGPNSKSTSTMSNNESKSQRPAMVSTGTMTSPPPSPTLRTTSATNRPIFRFPSSSSVHRSSSQPRTSHVSDITAASPAADTIDQKPSSKLDHRPRSQVSAADALLPSQTSLGTDHRSSFLGGTEVAVQRSRSANSRARPTSVQSTSKPGLLRRISREKAKPEESKHESFISPLIPAPSADADDVEDAVKIDSNVDFLKAMEEEDASKRKEKRLSSGSRHIKRASMPSVSLSGTKNLLAGRFGEAFKRFETNGISPESRDSSRSPVLRASGLTPIAGSEATDGRSDDGLDLEEAEEIPPEMRRELERRRLSQEEKRVADAAAAYRQRLAQGGDGGRRRPGEGPTNNKAMSIQSKVKTLLDESGRASPSPTKTASGYGRFTDPVTPEHPSMRQTEQEHPPRTSSRQPPPSNAMNPQQSSRAKPSLDAPPNLPKNSNQLNPPCTAPPSLTTDVPRHSAPPADRPFTRPAAPPKPQTKPQSLRIGDPTPQSPAKPPPLVARKPLLQQTQQPPSSNMAPMDGTDEDWESNFSRRYPDLAGLKMVETELDGGGGAMSGARRSQREVSVRDV